LKAPTGVRSISCFSRSLSCRRESGRRVPLRGKSKRKIRESSSWTKFYGVTAPVDNLSRITVDGSTGDNDYLRVTIESRNPAVLSWTRVPFTS